MRQDFIRQWCETRQNASTSDNDIVPIQKLTEGTFAEDSPTSFEVVYGRCHGKLAVLATSLLVQGHDVMLGKVDFILDRTSVCGLNALSIITKDVDETDERVAEAGIRAVGGEETA